MTTPPPSTLFSIGDWCVYPKQGVVEIVGIDQLTRGDNTTTFYLLRVPDRERKIRVAVDKVDSVGLRRVIQGEEVEEVFAILRQPPAKLDQWGWSRRHHVCLGKIKTGSANDLAEVLRDLQRLKRDHRLSPREDVLLDTARKILVKELSLGLGKDEAAVELEIDAILSDAVEG